MSSPHTASPLPIPPTSSPGFLNSEIDVLSIESNNSTISINSSSRGPNDPTGLVDHTNRTSSPSLSPANLLPTILCNPVSHHGQHQPQSLPHNATTIPTDVPPLCSHPDDKKNYNNTKLVPSVQSDGRPVDQSNPQAPLPPTCKTSPVNTPSKKNGKPLAKCSFCGMTFKKLEHCQRHERTHTLARPYSCAVCLKAFARQDTLNRHLRLHSRAEGKIALKKSTSQSQQSPTLVASAGSFIALPSRERGLSLSALEPSSFLGNHGRDSRNFCNGSRHSLPLLTPRFPNEQSFHQPSHTLPAHYNQPQLHHSPLTKSDLSSQPPGASPTPGYEMLEMSAETRRGSWCPGIKSHDQIPMLSTSETPPLPPHRINRQHVPHPLYFGMPAWESSLTNIFGLVESGTEPVPMSAPATCTKWSTLGPLPDIGSSKTMASSLVTPAWDNFRFEAQSSNLPSFEALGPLEEEDQTRFEPVSNGCNPTQLIMASSALQGPSSQPLLTESSLLTGSSTVQVTESDCNSSSIHWSLPLAQNSIPSYSGPYQLPSTPAGVTHRELSDCFQNYWQKPQKQSTVEMLSPKYLYPPSSLNDEDRNSKVVNNTEVANSNAIPINTGWEEVMRFNF